MNCAASRVRDTDLSGERCEGFTLIELLVAMTLLGLMFIALFEGIRFGTRAWEGSSQRVEDLAETEIAQDLIRRQLHQAWLPDERSIGWENLQAFEGSAEELRFIAPTPRHAGIGGYSQFMLKVTENEGRRDIRLSWQQLRPESSARALSGDGQLVLVEAVKSLTLTYYGTTASEEASGWHDGWNDARQLPRLIRVLVEFPSTDTRYWPELLVAPRTSDRAP